MRSVEYKELMERTWQRDIIIGVPGKPEDSILSRGDRLVLAGVQKSGKSVLMGQMIQALTTGGDFLGFPIPTPRKVLYVQAELREATLQKRYRPWAGRDIPDGKFFVWSTNGPLYLTGFDQHEKYYERQKNTVRPKHGLDLLYEEVQAVKPDVLMLDPLSSFHDVDESRSPDVKKLFDELDRLKEKTNPELGGCALVIAHHFRKESAQDKQAGIPLINQVRGSNALGGWADSIMCVAQVDGQPDTKYMEFTLRDTDIHPERLLHYNYEHKGFDWTDPLVEMARTVLAQPIMQEEPTVVMLATALKLLPPFRGKKDAYAKALVKINEMLNRGLLVKDEEGVVSGGLAPSQPTE